MFKIFVLFLVLPLAWCKPHGVTGGVQGEDDGAEPNSLDERLQELQQSVDGVVHLLHDQAAKLTDLRTRQDQIKQKQDAMKNEILARVDAKTGESSTKMNSLMEYIHSMKKLMTKDVVKFPNPIYGDENAKYFIQGHVEILHNNVWGTICDDSLDSSAANGNNVASVLCRMQGYEGGIYSRSFKQSTAHKSSQIWIRSAVCKGTGKNIGECTLGRWGGSGCQHTEDIGIRCYM